MTQIRNFVDVQISIQAARMATLGFNVCMFLVESDALDRTKVVSTIDTPDPADFGGAGTDLFNAFQTYTMQPLKAPTAVIACKRSGETYAEAMAAIRDENDDWYGVVSVTRVASDIEAIAPVIEGISPGRLHFSVTSDADVINNVASNLAEELQDAGYHRTALIYSSDADAWANAAQAAYLSFTEGSITFNYKELVGVGSETVTAAQFQNLKDLNCQVQLTVAGLKRVYNSGMVASGEWIDIMHGTDWITARISEGVFAILATLPKVPYNLAGAALIDSEVKRNLAVASDEPHNFIEDDYTTKVPNPRGQSAADRANRFLPGFTFVAHPQGAVHLAEIRGNLVI